MSPSSWFKTFMAATGVEVGGYKPGKSRPGPPMDLANMRQNGVRSLSVSCWICHRNAVVNVDRFDDAVPVPSFGPRMMCTGCGIIGADARPNWSEQPKRESLTGARQPSR
jgi:hypothetical protein